MRLGTVECLNGVRKNFRPKRAPKSLLGVDVCCYRVGRFNDFRNEIECARGLSDQVNSVGGRERARGRDRTVPDDVTWFPAVIAELVVPSALSFCIREASPRDKVEFHRCSSVASHGLWTGALDCRVDWSKLRRRARLNGWGGGERLGGGGTPGGCGTTAYSRWRVSSGP